jgi:hypothetical protein
MEQERTTVINSGLPGFQMLDAIGMLDAEGIAGVCSLSGALPYLGIECLAQLGAWHVRYLTDFSCHAVLLKITRCRMFRQALHPGPYRLTGRLESRSTLAFAYELAALREGKLEIQGNFLYAATDYDNSFRRELLQDHYRRIFQCLKSATGND